MKWYYEKDGKQQGPVDETEIRSLLVNETINVRSKVWHKGLDSWKVIAEVMGSDIPDEVPALSN